MHYQCVPHTLYVVAGALTVAGAGAPSESGVWVWVRVLSQLDSFQQSVLVCLWNVDTDPSPSQAVRVARRRASWATRVLAAAQVGVRLRAFVREFYQTNLFLVCRRCGRRVGEHRGRLEHAFR